MQRRQHRHRQRLRFNLRIFSLRHSQRGDTGQRQQVAFQLRIHSLDYSQGRDPGMSCRSLCIAQTVRRSCSGIIRSLETRIAQPRGRRASQTRCAGEKSIMKQISLCARTLCLAALMGGTPLLHAEDAKPFDAAAAFGARVDIQSLRLSPDGMSVAFVTPIPGQGGVVYTQSLAPGAKAKVAFYADGKPYRLRGCNWVSNDRLVCAVYGIVHGQGNFVAAGLLPVTRLMSVNADGTKPQQLSIQQSPYAAGLALSDTTVIDWLPDQDGSVLMARAYVPTYHPESLAGNKEASGVGV